MRCRAAYNLASSTAFQVPLLSSTDSDFLFSQLERPLVFVDLETTGGHALNDRITEIGVVRVSAAGVEQWSALVNPQRPIPWFIQRLTGINDAMVRDAPEFAAVAGHLLAKLEGGLFVAHNARFDHGFLRASFQRHEIEFNPDMLCTVRLSRAMFPDGGRHGLDAVIERLGLVPNGRHRALADADLIWQFWRRMHQLHPREAIEAAIAKLTVRAALAQAEKKRKKAVIAVAPNPWNAVPLDADEANAAL
jgi:DNA polymerase-3 subunit epsilon